MKRFLLLAAMMVVGLTAVSAQDLLTKQNGDDLQVIVKEINASEVKYVLFDESNGVIYTLPKSEIMMIRYASGRKEVFSNTTAKTAKNAYMYAAPSSNIYYGMKYKELKNIYSPRDYDNRSIARYSPAWAGVGSFFIPGLGQMCCGEFWRGLGQFGVNFGLGLVSLTTSDEGVYTTFALAKLAYGIWSIVDAVRVAKVKNMYETDLRSLRSSVSIDMYPSLNTIPTNSGFGVAPGMTLSLTF